MLPKSQNISARLPQEDYDFLMGFKANEATTVSEKLRELIRLAKDQKEQNASIAKSIAANTKYLSGLKGTVKQIELEDGSYSEILEIFFSLVPDLNAIATQDHRFQDKNELINLEKVLARRFFHLIDRVLRLSFTQPAPCYSPDVLENLTQNVAMLLQLSPQPSTPKGE